MGRVKSNTNKKTAKEKLREKTTQEKLSEAKAKMDKKISDAKKEYADFKARLQKAKEVGYTSGVKDYDKMPKGRGMILTAQKNYGDAMRDIRKKDNLNNKINSGGKKNGKKSWCIKNKRNKN